VAVQKLASTANKIAFSIKKGEHPQAPADSQPILSFRCQAGRLLGGAGPGRWRGGTRPFGKFWGTAIYGQCEPAIAPLALTTAYDMGARYFWFWTSDHAHHVPWNEQLGLARTLKEYAAKHPRPSIYLPQPKRDTVIAIPNGYFLSLRDFEWNKSDDAERRETGEKFRRVLQRAFNAAHQCFDRGEDFDITVNDGHRLEGYRRIIKIDDK